LLRNPCKGHSDWRYTSRRQTPSRLTCFETRQGRWPCQRCWMSHPEILRNASPAPPRVCLPQRTYVREFCGTVSPPPGQCPCESSPGVAWDRLYLVTPCGKGKYDPNHVVCLIISLLPEERTVVVSEWSGGIIGTVTNCCFCLREGRAGLLAKSPGDWNVSYEVTIHQCVLDIDSEGDRAGMGKVEKERRADHRQWHSRLE
jgi:hypothetical protein